MSRYRLLPTPAVSAALSTGELLHVPGLTVRERRRMWRLERKLARAKRGSNRRGRVKLAIARLRAGRWTGTRVRAKPNSSASPAGTPATRM